jgi:hypothetical protein
MKQLPTFKGWTVDIRLKEFRKVTEEGMQFLSFDSEEGDALLGDFILTLDEHDPLFIEIAELFL